ncbi:Hypothetical predicted protein [Olea europaea subsp. europaea]|uniref:Uncharacterized protein n=1 Tax=Olea europaea subsp. europaea TaxID=158383 RepID=A0A8S0QIE7_OLEEU|nr:Hypothetical predicted protein [Olea europaea subsp. europaea]
MHAKLADAKIAAETKLAEAQSVMENAQKKFMEAEENMMENVTNGWKLRKLPKEMDFIENGIVQLVT